MRFSVISIALGLAGIYALYCGVLFAGQRAMLFPRHQISEPAPVELGPFGAEVMQIETGFGQVEAWFFPPTSGGDGPWPAVVMAHGNTELIDHYPATYPDKFMRFLDLGMAVYLVEYPGYGRSDGSPSEASVTEGFVAAYDSLVARPDVDGERILLFGRSLGGGAVCALAAKRPSRAMILFSTFSSVRDMAGEFMIPRFLVLDPFDNLGVVRSYPGPVLVLHGTEDRLIPYEQGRKLAAEAGKGTLLTYTCGHGDCPTDWDDYWRQVTMFLRKAGFPI